MFNINSNYKILIIIPYFGEFPSWAPLYFESIKRNPSIDFLFITDCDFSHFESIPNCIFQKIEFEHYVRIVNERTKLKFNPGNAYKLCDLRPLFSMIHQIEIAEYQFFGWSDMDIIYGDIRSFYNDELLEKYDVLSTHEIRVSGHFALLKNTPKNRNLYKAIYNFKKYLEHPDFVGLDEHGITNALTLTFFDKLNQKMGWNIENKLTRWLRKKKKAKLYLVEQYTTPFTSIPWLDGSLNGNQPDTWYYNDGIITNNRDVNRTFIYLHLMNFKSSTYRHDGSTAPWEKLNVVYNVKPNQLSWKIKINNEGISAIA